MTDITPPSTVDTDTHQVNEMKGSILTTMNKNIMSLSDKVVELTLKISHIEEQQIRLYKFMKEPNARK
jgi:hypothetical protein